MHHFHYKEKDLYCEEVPVSKVIDQFGTPLYIYSHATLTQHFKAFDSAFEGIRHLTCFSMKSNSNLAVIRLFARLGAGMDIVSSGELFRALKAGVPPEKIVFSGVGKRREDIEYALKSGIFLFNVESRQEMLCINEIAGNLEKKARIALRVNPDVNPQTHPYISTGLKENKFGIDINEAAEHYALAEKLDNLVVTGVSCHIGSQLTRVSPFVEALEKLKHLIEKLRAEGLTIDYLDLGGGLGIRYNDETPPHPKEYADAVIEKLGKTALTMILEPGRVIMGNSGVLITKLLYTKKNVDKTFYIVDAAMNDLTRPALYNSYHAVQPLRDSEREKLTADIVGPICETGDFLAKGRLVPALEQGEFMAIMSAGAYGFSMASNYNSRPRPCEVMVKGSSFQIIRHRESLEDLIRGEVIPDYLM